MFRLYIYIMYICVCMCVYIHEHIIEFDYHYDRYLCLYEMIASYSDADYTMIVLMTSRELMSISEYEYNTILAVEKTNRSR